MKLDFSKGIDYWKEIILTFLEYVNDFWEQITGSPLFTNSSKGALSRGEEETTVGEEL